MTGGNAYSNPDSNLLPPANTIWAVYALENAGLSQSQAAQLIYPLSQKNNYWDFHGPYAAQVQNIFAAAQSANQSFINWFIIGVIGAIALTLLIIFIL